MVILGRCPHFMGLTSEYRDIQNVLENINHPSIQQQGRGK